MHNPLNVAHVRNEANASFSVRKILQRLRIKCMGQVDRVFVRVSIHGRTMRQRQCAVHATLLAPRDSKMELWNERILAGTGVLCAPQCRHFVWGLISVYYTQSAPLYDAGDIPCMNTFFFSRINHFSECVGQNFKENSFVQKCLKLLLHSYF